MYLRLGREQHLATTGLALPASAMRARRPHEESSPALARFPVAAATTGNRGHFVSNQLGSPMNAGLSFSNNSYVESRVPDWVPNRRPRRLAPETRKPRRHRGFRNGETRTRTGDTTIFRESPRAPLRLETPANRQLWRVAARRPCFRFGVVSRGFGTSSGGRSPKRRWAPSGEPTAGGGIAGRDLRRLEAKPCPTTRRRTPGGPAGRRARRIRAHLRLHRRVPDRRCDPPARGGLRAAHAAGSGACRRSVAVSRMLSCCSTTSRTPSARERKRAFPLGPVSGISA